MTVNDLRQLLAEYYRFGVPHPGGSAGWLEEQFGIDMHDRCPMCDEPPPPGTRIVSCPICSFGRCVRCAVSHDEERGRRKGNSLCSQVAAFAEMHALLRADEESGFSLALDRVVVPEREDFFAARLAFASTVARGCP